MPKVKKAKIEEECDQFPGPGYSPPAKKSRPKSDASRKSQVVKRRMEFRAKMENYDPSHTVYTVITPEGTQFSGSARRICEEIITRKEEDLKIGVYTGVNSRESVADHDSRKFSAISDARAEGRTPIQVDVMTFASRTLARKEEALRQVRNYS